MLVETVMNTEGGKPTEKLTVTFSGNLKKGEGKRLSFLS